MEFSRLEYWSGQLFLLPGDLPNPETEPRSLTLQVDSLPAEPPYMHTVIIKVHKKPVIGNVSFNQGKNCRSETEMAEFGCTQIC